MKKISIIITIFIIPLLFYSLTLRGIAGNIKPGDFKNNLDQAAKPFELSPERGRFILTMSLAENKSFSLDKELADAASPDVGVYKDRFYIFFPPGISILGLPFYLIGKNFNISQVATFAVISFFASLNFLLIFLISKKILKLPASLSLLASLIFGFASTSWSYAITLYQHQVTTFLILSSFLAVWNYAKGSKSSWIYGLYVWLAYGYGIWIDYPNAILLLPVMIYFLLASFHFVKVKNIFKFNLNLSLMITSVIFVIIIGLHGYYNYKNFGSWKRLSGSLISIGGYKEAKKENSQAADKKLVEAANKKSDVVGFFTEENFPKGLSILLFSRDRGLFLYAPIFILGILGIILSFSAVSLETGVLMGIFLVNLFLYSSWGDPWGGWAYGPRYLIPSMSVLSMFAVLFLAKIKKIIPYLIVRFIAFILFIYSSAIALLGALTTNQIPPKVEADFLKMKYNFLLNYQYLKSGTSGSYVFNTYVSKYLNLWQYFIIIWGGLIAIAYILLFVVPVFENKNEH